MLRIGGEDAQIFTHEELVEQFELFKEGVESDEDKRLLYLQFIREFKETNPREFKRIKQFPQKARTARNLKNAKKENLSASTVIFLKSAYKSEFYKADDLNRVSPLTFIEAAELFEANSNEPAFDLPAKHFDHVQNALRAFEQDFFGSATNTVASKDKSDGYSKQAQKFLRDLKTLSSRKELKLVCDKLCEFIDKGIYTPIPNEIKKIRQSLDKRKITFAEAENLILRLAKKYDAHEKEDDELQTLTIKIDANIEPEIVLSETFFE